MKLLKLILTNFQGVTSAIHDFSGKSATFYGYNETGKTTVNNAYAWLLFDKASTGAKNFTPKTIIDEQEAHFLDHSVEGTFELADGRIVTYKKVYHENYKTKRGETEKTFDGHTTDYFIDGVPKSLKEYELDMMMNYKSAEIAKMLTSPLYFADELEWKDRRRILFEICGDYSDQEILNLSPELHPLIPFLLIPGTENQFRTVDDYKKIADARGKVLDAEIKKIPTKINEAKLAIPDLTGLTIESINAEIETLREQQHALEIEMMQASDGTSKHTKLRGELADINTKLSEERLKFSNANGAIFEAINKKIAGFNEQLNAENTDRIALLTTIHSEEARIETMNKLRITLMQKYKETMALTWDEHKETCPTCNQSLPADQVDELKAQFNLNKSKQLEEINTQGKKEADKEVIAELTSKVEKMRMTLNGLEPIVQGIQNAIKKLEAEKVAQPKFEDTEVYKDIDAAIKAIQTRLQFADNESADLKTPFRTKISALVATIEELSATKLKFSTKATQEARVKELEGELKTFSAEYEKLQSGLYLCEQFIRIKAKMLDERINSRFKNVKFRLFIDQVNGGLKEDCEVLVKSKEGNYVPFPFANNGGKINAGLEIIEILSEHYKVKLPIFVDNAESVTGLNEIDAQIVRLVVSAAHKTLTMEVN